MLKMFKFIVLLIISSSCVDAGFELGCCPPLPDSPSQLFYCRGQGKGSCNLSSCCKCDTNCECKC